MVDLNTLEAELSLPIVPQRSRQSLVASVILVEYTRQGGHQAERPSKFKACGTVKDPKRGASTTKSDPERNFEECLHV